jgi:cytochrome c biogenesis protein CcmG/thiol:disulfide interchange protein DsbE
MSHARMNIRRPFLSLVALLALIGGAAWLMFHRDIEHVMVGSVAPDFKARNLRTGHDITLHTEYANTVTLINIWGTWCGPCVKEMPAMDSLYRAYASRGFRIAAVSVDEPSLDNVKKFVAEHAISFDVLNDSIGTIKTTYQTTGVPESFLIDRTGHIIRIAQLAAPWNSAQNRRIVEELLAEPAR